MSLAACIMPLALHDPLAGLLETALGEVVLQDGLRSLLHLQEERILLVATLQQDDERPRAHAAHPDDLPRDVDDLEAFQQSAAVVRQGRSIGAELAVDELCEVVRRHPFELWELTERHHDRRLVDDAVLTVHFLRQLG